jgi:hypothetical protein
MPAGRVIEAAGLMGLSSLFGMLRAEIWESTSFAAGGLVPDARKIVDGKCAASPQVAASVSVALGRRVKMEEEAAGESEGEVLIPAVVVLRESAA